MPFLRSKVTLHMIIRQVTINDLQQCFALERSCFPEEEAASLENIRTRIEQFPEGFYILEDLNNKIIGHINSGCTHKSDITDEAFKGLIGHNADGDNMVIFSLAIHPDKREKKYGHQLLRHFEKQCKAMEKARILLLCKTNLIPYYKTAGYSYKNLSSSTHGGAEWHEMELLLQ